MQKYAPCRHNMAFKVIILLTDILNGQVITIA
jgi:hypothetical protein